MRIVLENWKKQIIVTKEADISDPLVLRKAKSLERAADDALSRFTRDEDAPSLFLGRAPDKSADMSQEYLQIYRIARSWASLGTKHYQDPKILDILKFSIEWMYNHRYGQNEIEGKGWRSTRIFNWYDWHIGSPNSLIPTLLCLYDEISREDCKRYLALYDLLVPKPSDYGANKIHRAKSIIGSGILCDDEKKIEIAIEGTRDTNIYVDGGLNDKQGFYTDGSYIFHTLHPMNGTYGAGHFTCLTELCLLFAGTKYADPALEKMVPDLAEKAYLPFISRTITTRSVMGRYPDNGPGTGLTLLAAVCECAALAKDEQRRRLLDMVKLNLIANPELATEDALGGFYMRLSNEALVLIKAAMADPTYGAKPYRANRVFGNEDRVVHHYDGVAFSLAMSSSRIYNYECINHVNMKGWYLGDGMLTAWGDDFYSYKSVFNKQDPYHRPGTTLDLREREEITIAQKNEYLSSQDFVGGVTTGTVGGAAMRLESYHGDGVPARPVHNDDYGGAPAKRDCTLLAKKSYFFKGKTAVCLGADISSSDGAPVVTVIDSRYTKSPLKTPNGSEIPLENEVKPIGNDLEALYIQGFGGYVFLEDMKLSAGRCGEDGAFIDILCEHGVDPKNGTYSYVLLPSATEKQTIDYAREHDVKILANNKDVQAVEYKDGTIIATFWEKGKAGCIEAENPCMAILKGSELYLSDPTQKQLAVTVKVGGKSYTASTENKYGATVKLSITK